MDELTQQMKRAKRECDEAWEEYKRAERAERSARETLAEAKRIYRDKVAACDELAAKIPSADEFKAQMRATGTSMSAN